MFTTVFGPSIVNTAGNVALRFWGCVVMPKPGRPIENPPVCHVSFVCIVWAFMVTTDAVLLTGEKKVRQLLSVISVGMTPMCTNTVVLEVGRRGHGSQP